MIPVLAHQGGWDEILLPALVVLGLLWASRRRQRREAAAAAPEEPRIATCAYCGARLTEDARRCPSCGFRVTSG
jgi:MYXO-CTERM domain-containing protein